MVNVYNYGEENRTLGLANTDVRVMIEVLREYMEAFSEVYDGRCGTVILDAQPAMFVKPLKTSGEIPCIRAITYGQPKCLLRFDPPGGRAESIFFDSAKVASEAIDSLLEGKRFFYGHKNASLNGNIYKTSGTDKTYESGHLLILNALYGRFLVGCGDARADSDQRGEHDFVLIAIARTLAKMFPKDEEIQASFDWVRRASSLNYYLCDMVVGEIDNLFESMPAYIRDYWRSREEIKAAALQRHEAAPEFLPFI